LPLSLVTRFGAELLAPSSDRGLAEWSTADAGWSLATDGRSLAGGVERFRDFDAHARSSLDRDVGLSAAFNSCSDSAAGDNSPRGIAFKGWSIARTGSTRPAVAVGGATIGATTVLLGANIAAAARCESRSNPDSGALVSNKRALMPGPVVRPGRLRISIEKEGIGRFKFVLVNFGLLERIALISVTLRGKGAESNMRMLLNEFGKIGARQLNALEAIRVGD
jgi:hypothetical protein